MNAASPHDCLTVQAAARRLGVTATSFRAWAKRMGILVRIAIPAGDDPERVWWGDVERAIRATSEVAREPATPSELPRRVLRGR